MAYNSYVFLVLFLGCTLLLYYLLPKKVRWVVLLAASVVFYWSYSRLLIVWLLICAAAVYGGGLWLQRTADNAAARRAGLTREEKKAFKARTTRKKKWICAGVLTVAFGLLVFFKYYNFLAESINGLLGLFGGAAGLPALKLFMPLGISFYTLQAAGYLIDVYRGKIAAERNYLRLTLFLCYFPQIVEGPIGRYDALASQLYEGHAFDYTGVKFGGQLLVFGLFKKMVIADRAAALVGCVFDHAPDYGGLAVLLAMLVYTLQIYTDFSGSIDMVSGVSEMFGVRLAKNFEQPFFSRSIGEFWRRWHITLGAWLRDYIFYSVSLSSCFMKLSKRARARLSDHFAKCLPAAFALLFVWLGNGIWHGAAWKYIAYGMYYYVIMLLGMLLEPVFVKVRARLHVTDASKGYRVFQMLRTFVLVNLGMLLFRADSVAAAWRMLKSVFTGMRLSALYDGSLLSLGLDGHDFTVLLLGTVVLFVVGLMKERGVCLRQRLSEKPLVLRWSVYLAAIFAVILLGAYGAGYGAIDPIYAQF